MKMSRDRLKRRMSEIEDRKVEILMETGEENARYSEKISRLNSEYERLDREYRDLLFRSIRGKKGYTEGVDNDGI
jgi:hypothetical protein